MGLMQPLAMNTAGLIELLARADTADLFSGTDLLDKSPVDVLVLAPLVSVAGLISDGEVTIGVVSPIDIADHVGNKHVAGLELTEHNVAKPDRLWMQHRLEYDQISVVCMRPQRATRRLVYH